MTEVLDNRLHLEVDPKQVETWELLVAESAKIGDWLLMFSRYVANGRGILCPDLPTDPIDELTPEQIATIKNSEAYKALKRFKTAQLKAAAESFAEQAVGGF